MLGSISHHKLWRNARGGEQLQSQYILIRTMKPVFVADLLLLLAFVVFSFAESNSHVLKKRGYRGYDGSGSYSSEEEPSYKHRRGYSSKCHHHHPSYEGDYPFGGFPYGYPMQFPQPHIPPPMIFPPLQLPPASPIQADLGSPKIAPPTWEGYPILEGPLALQGSPALEGPLALQGSPALEGPLALQGSPALEGPLALQGSPALEGPLALQGSPALEGPLALQGSPALEGPLALQGSPALEGPLALQGSPALEGPLALQGSPALEGPLALQGSPALEGPLALQGSPALEGPLALQGSPALEGPLAGSPAIQSAVAPEPVVADSAIAPSPLASLQVPSPWVGGRKKRSFPVAATKEKTDEKEVKSGASQAKESDGQMVKRKKRKVNNEYVPKKAYGAETTHAPYTQPPHEYSPKTDGKGGKNKKLKTPTGEKEEEGAAKAGGSDNAYAQFQSYKKKQKQEEKKPKPLNKEEEEEEEESLLGTNEQNSEFTQGGPQFRSTWDVRRRRRSNPTFLVPPPSS
uniref:Uncharacterized protein n=1 Tax=Globodera rostochiensis TaxID=31243 RepID=A0A914HCN8_GLORO